MKHDPEAASPCGPSLTQCRCRRLGPIVHTEEERRALHVAAVNRARRPEPVPLRILTEEERRAAYVRFTERQSKRGAA